MKYIHILIDLFANGKSSMKVYLFFTFLGMLLLIKKAFAPNRLNQEGLKKTILGLIAVLFALNAGSFLYFFRSQDIPLLSNVYVFNNHEVSSTNILHNHTLKAPIGFILQKVGINPVQEYVDTGFAFTPFFSPIFLSLVLTLALLLLIACIMYIQGQKNTPLQTLIFGIISFSILKNIFDGGIFHIETILAVSALLIVLTNNLYYQRKDQQRNILFFLIYLLVGIILAVVTRTHLPLHGVNFSIEFLEKFFFFVALIVLYYKSQIKKITVWLSVAPILSFIFFTYVSTAMYGYQNNMTVILPSQEIITYSTSTVQAIFDVDDMSAFDGAVLSSGHVSKDIAKSELMKILGIDTSFNTLDLPDITCEKTMPDVRNFETRLSDEDISISMHESLFSISKLGKQVSVEENGCTHLNQSMLKAIFVGNGIDNVILIQHD